MCGYAYSTSVRDLRYLVKEEHQQGVHDFDTLSVRLEDAASLTEESFRSRTASATGEATVRSALFGGSDTVLDSSSDESACMGPDGSPKNSISLCPV